MEEAPSGNAGRQTSNGEVSLDNTVQDGAALRNDPRAVTKNDTKPPGTSKVASKKSSRKKQDDKSKKTEHKRRTKKTKQPCLSDGDSSSSDSSASSPSSQSTTSTEKDTDSDSNSTSSEEEKPRRKEKANAKAVAKEVAKILEAKESKQRRKKAAQDKDSYDNDESSLYSVENLVGKATARAKRARAAKRKAREAEDSDDMDLAEDPASSKLRAMKAQMAQLGLHAGRHAKSGRSARLGLSGLSRRELGLDSTRGHGKLKKAETPKKIKRASKVAFKRVDQLWDSSIHNYKLTETVDDPDADEWDQYIFTVRRKFDWEHKYQETLVDIRSKPLKEALRHVMADVKGVSLVQETPHLDPNMLFLYLEESRAHMKELRTASRNEKKKKLRKSAAAKAKHQISR